MKVTKITLREYFMIDALKLNNPADFSDFRVNLPDQILSTQGVIMRQQIMSRNEPSIVNKVVKRGRPRKTENVLSDIPPSQICKEFKMFDGLFDLDDMSDLPTSVKEALVFPKTSINYQILELFKHKEQLNQNEIIVGRYRTFGEISHRATIYTRCQCLNKQGFLNKVPGKTGTFSLADR